MFWDIPYWQIGFDYDEWQLIPRGCKAIIRDYYLNGCNSDETLKYGFYETEFQVKKVEREYDLDKRPRLIIGVDEFSIA